MAIITGGELAVRTLMKAGVEVMFGLHGAHIDTIFQACLDHGLPIIDTRNEAGAGHAAEGYARTAQRLGVALVTAGGGFTNAVTPLANAYLDRTPILVITGSGALRDSETNTLQAGIDQVAVAKPITKWAYRITNTEQIPRLLAQAARIALTAPRGPVLIDIPWDVLSDRIEEAAAPIPDTALPAYGSAPDARTISAALDLLAAAERPVIIVGGEAHQSRSDAALRALVQATGIPVFGDYEGLNLLSDLGDGSGGLIQNLITFRPRGATPDVVMMAGMRFGLNTAHGSGVYIPLDARIIQIDPDPAELARLQHVEISVVSDPGGALHALAEAARDRCWPDRRPWRKRVGELVHERRATVARLAGPEDAKPLHPYHAASEVARHFGPDTGVVADGALTYLWLSETVSEARPYRHLCHGYLGSMGVGMGVALGAQAALKAGAKRVILVTGDGAVGYALGEIDGMVRHKLPVTIVVMNNRSWGATQHFQRLMAGPNRTTNTMLQNGAYEQVAIALGAGGYTANDVGELREAMKQALASDQPSLINVRVALDPIPPEEMALIGKNPFAAEPSSGPG
jgi:acetolactate synthase-1/2/3 large subunit